nr:hypothetical protein [Rhodovulum sulfidophilum]
MRQQPFRQREDRPGSWDTGNQLLQLSHEDVVVDIVEIADDVSLDHEFIAPTSPLLDPGDGLCHAAVRPVREGAFLEMRLEDWHQCRGNAGMGHPVPDAGNRENAVAGFLFRNADLAVRARDIFAAQQVGAQLVQPGKKVRAELIPRHSVTPGGPFIGIDACPCGAEGIVAGDAVP